MMRTMLPLMLAGVMVLVAGCDPEEQYQAPDAAVTTTPSDPPASPSVAPPAKPAAAKQPAPQVNESGFIAPEERRELYLDFHFTDQENRAVVLSDLVGKPMAITFMFTSCPRPDMCPLITATVARLQRQLAEADIADDVQLLLISYDPQTDTPEVLKKYGERFGIRWHNARMLRPEIRDMPDLKHELDIGIIPSSTGDIGHFIELILIDRHGREAFWRRDTIWDNDKITEMLQQLVAEAPEGARDAT